MRPCAIDKWRLGGGGVARCVVRVEDAHRVQNVAAACRRRHIRMRTCGEDLVPAQPRLGNRDIDKLGIRTNAGLGFHEGLREGGDVPADVGYAPRRWPIRPDRARCGGSPSTARRGMRPIHCVSQSTYASNSPSKNCWRVATKSSIAARFLRARLRSRSVLYTRASSSDMWEAA